MKKRFIALGVIVIIAISIATGYFIGSGRLAVPLFSDSNTSMTTSISTICSISGETNGVQLRVVEENYSSKPATTIPVANAKVSGSDVYYCNNVRAEGEFVPSTTNSSGWASLLFGGGGIYYLNISSSLTYTISVPVAPLATTFATYNISTGNLTTSICYYGEHC